jgi:hypothetical protein
LSEMLHGCATKYLHQLFHTALSPSRTPHPRMKKSALPLMHSSVALPQANHRTHERKCAQLGASPLTCRSVIEIVVVFRTNDV